MSPKIKPKGRPYATLSRAIKLNIYTSQARIKSLNLKMKVATLPGKMK
jgi:hypothetical protein